MLTRKRSSKWPSREKDCNNMEYQWFREMLISLVRIWRNWRLIIQLCEIQIILNFAKTSGENLEFYKEWGKAVGEFLKGREGAMRHFPCWPAANICITGWDTRKTRQKQQIEPAEIICNTCRYIKLETQVCTSDIRMENIAQPTLVKTSRGFHKLVFKEVGNWDNELSWTGCHLILLKLGGKTS